MKLILHNLIPLILFPLYMLGKASSNNLFMLLWSICFTFLDYYAWKQLCTMQTGPLNVRELCSLHSIFFFTFCLKMNFQFSYCTL